jgi:8-oxo-dGTP diphosphatase
MGLFDSIGLGWKPREGMVYTYKRWHRRKNLLWHPPMAQGQDAWPEGTRSQNLSKVYVIIDEKPHLGTFRVSKGVCTLGVVQHKHVERLYKTDADNMKFWKKDTGTSRVHPRFGNTVNITKHYEYVAKVLDSTKLVKERPPKQIVRRRGTAIVDTKKGILIASHGKTWLLPGGGANKGEDREKATIRELKEETGLITKRSKYLFSYDEPDDRHIRNLHKVFLIDATGTAKPNHHDVKKLAYWTTDSNIELSRTTKKIVDKYLNEFKVHRKS